MRIASPPFQALRPMVLPVATNSEPPIAATPPIDPALRFAGEHVAIVGDVLHSRVARSNIAAATPADAIRMFDDIASAFAAARGEGDALSAPLSEDVTEHVLSKKD